MRDEFESLARKTRVDIAKKTISPYSDIFLSPCFSTAQTIILTAGLIFVSLFEVLFRSELRQKIQAIQKSCLQ